MGRRAAIERIELIDSRDATDFGAAFAPSPPPAPPRRSRHRWPRILAPLVIVAIVAGVAIAVTLTDDDRSAPPPPTTQVPAPSTNRPTPTTAAPVANRAARLVGTYPAGLAAPLAFEADDAGGGPAPGQPTSAALWADGIDASPGTRYVEVRAAPERSYGSGLGTVRIDTPFGPAVASVQHGRTMVAGPTSDGWATVDAVGLTLGESTHVLETVRIVDDRIVTGGVAVPAGLHLVGRSDGAAPEWQSSTQTRASSGTAGASTAGVAPSRYLTLEVGPAMTAYQQTVEWFFLAGAGRVDVGEERASLGTSSVAGERELTFDRDGLHIVIGAGGIVDEDVVAFARSLHVAGDAAWQTMLDQHRLGGPASNSASLSACASGVLPGPVNWSAKCAIDQATPQVLELELDMTSPNGPTFGTITRLDVSGPTIAGAATDRLSYVTAAVPVASAGAVLRVLVGDSVVGTAPFSALDHAGGQFAIVAFTELEPYTAQIVAADGAILAAYDPLTAAA